MGLASSQARLLSLTSRQHTIEANAQRLMSEKMRLSNSSDAVYQKYMNALDETALKTRQTNDVGETSWIDGSINNLMRYNASDNTSGTVFYVQDMDSGKLYVPKEVFDNYNNLTAATVPTGYDYTDAMKFATLFGVEYKRIDNNEDILINYNQAIEKGWDKALTDEQYDKYTVEANKDKDIQAVAQTLRGMLPTGLTTMSSTKDGITTTSQVYKLGTSKKAIAQNYEAFVMQILGSPSQSAAYQAKDLALLQESLDLMKTISANAEEDKVYKEGVEAPAAGGSTTTTNVTATKTYTTKEIKANNGTLDYVSVTDGSNEFDGDTKFELMLNGGTITWSATYDVEYSNKWAQRLYGQKDVETSKTTNIYDADTANVLAQYGATTMGEALTSLFDKMSATTQYSAGILQNMGKTKDDVVNYRKFKDVQTAYSMYTPDYEYVATDKVKAAYYEGVYNAINAAGGCEQVNDDTAKNATWVQNMIKNTKVILTTWDSSENMLSRTSAALNVDVKEISDDHKVQQAEQDYEAETELINAKDTKIDNILNKLETERSSIKTEIDGIQKIMDDNVNVNFKVFS